MNKLKIKIIPVRYFIRFNSLGNGPQGNDLAVLNSNHIFSNVVFKNGDFNSKRLVLYLNTSQKRKIGDFSM